MRRALSLVLTTTFLVLFVSVSADARSFKSCNELRSVYKYGVSASAKSINRGSGPIYKPKVLSSVYRANIRLDLDRDKIVCEVVRPRVSPTPPPVENPSSDLPKLDLCRITQGSNPLGVLRTGFPRSQELTLENNKAIVQLIYVDFSDLSDSKPPSEDVAFFSEGVDAFFDAMSDNQVDFEWRYQNRYIRMPKPISAYGLTRAGGGNFTQFVQDAITLADPVVDFTEVDFVVAVMPPNVTRSQADVSPALVNPESPFRTNEGKIFRATLAAADTRFKEGYLLIAHEFGHLLGLQDYYNLAWNQSMGYHEQFSFMGQFDNMNFATGNSREWTAWNRWALGFLSDNKVICLANGSPLRSEFKLVPGSASTAGLQMVVIPTSTNAAIVIESRRNLRYDSLASSISNGLLVYRIDTSLTSGRGPIRVIPKPTSSDLFLADAPLREGQSMTVDGFTISNIRSASTWDVLQVIRPN